MMDIRIKSKIVPVYTKTNSYTCMCTRFAKHLYKLIYYVPTCTCICYSFVHVRACASEHVVFY